MKIYTCCFLVETNCSVSVVVGLAIKFVSDQRNLSALIDGRKDEEVATLCICTLVLRLAETKYAIRCGEEGCVPQLCPYQCAVCTRD